ncbi:MAG: MoxR family ATPase [Spirochaetales bacterium]|nr:MoxR family ATPase [Spirochaetales bacterium]
MNEDKAMDKIEEIRFKYSLLKKELSRVIIGQENIIEAIFTALLCNGHILLEGVPGLGKTSLIKAFGSAMDLSVSRIQFTPDLMPADITGTLIINQDDNNKRYFEFQKGPVFANIVLADEINRATPKTQSALLEAMQEQGVTVGGTLHELESPFIVLATQNPIELEGTYPLPEAQLDRFFFKLKITFPSFNELKEIITLTTDKPADRPEKALNGKFINSIKSFIIKVPVAAHVKDYVLKILLATHPDSEFATARVKKYVKYGSSPRGAQAILLAAKVKAVFESRFNVSMEDVREMLLPCLRHRIILNFEGEAEGISPENIIEDIVKAAE